MANIPMTFHELVTNPAGKGSAQIANRGRIITDLKQRANNKKESKGIDLTVYKDGNNFLLFFKVKSESWQDLWYDTVIELSPPKGVDTSNEMTIASYEVKFISNMPSFAFTYFYAVNKKGLLLESFKTKFPDIFLKEAPKVRNPHMDMGFEKSIMLCAYFLTSKRWHFIDALNNLSKGKPNYLVLYKKFMSFEKKMKEYKEKQKATRDAQHKTGFKLSNSGRQISLRKKKIEPIESKKKNTAKKSLSKKRKKFSSEK